MDRAMIRFVRKFKLLACLLISFLIGACIGAPSYNSNFKCLAALVPLIIQVLCVFWMSLCLLLKRGNAAKLRLWMIKSEMMKPSRLNFMTDIYIYIYSTSIQGPGYTQAVFEKKI
jgi:hypothetical protein